MKGPGIASRLAVLTVLVATAAYTSSATAAPIDRSSADTMEWVSVSFAPALATQVPEPSVIILVALCAVAIVARQIRRLRRTRTARLN